MLAANVDDRDAMALPRSPTKRKNMLKKTFHVIGKVKPFKKNKQRTMELMNSCASFDFEAERDDSAGTSTDDIETTQGDTETTEKEEGEAELEFVSRNLDIFNDSCDDRYDDDNAEHGEVVLSGNPNRGGNSNSTTGSSAPSKSPKPPTSGLQLESPKIARRSRSSKEPSSRSPEGHMLALTSSLTSSHRSAPLSENLTTVQITRSSSLPTNTRHRNFEDNKTPSSLQASLQMPRRPVQPSGDGDDFIAEPLKRCSEAFSDNSAMGGYFAKLQEKVSIEAKKTQSCKVEDDAIHSGNSLNDKPRRQFKPSRNIKKLLGMKKTETEAGDLKPDTHTMGPELARKEEAVNFMLQLNTLLVSNTVDTEQRRLRSHKTRASRSFVFDEVDDDDLTQEFPEIPATKKTSLSEIRRMMESLDVNPLGITHKGPKQPAAKRQPLHEAHTCRDTRSIVFDQEQEDGKLAAEARLSQRHTRRSLGQTGVDTLGTTPCRPKHQSGRMPSSDKVRVSKSHHERSHRRSLASNDGEEARSLKKSLIMDHSPTSLAELPTDDKEIEEQVKAFSPRSYNEEDLRPQRSQKDSVDDVELGNQMGDSEEIPPIMPSSRQSRRTSIRNYDTSNHGPIHVNIDNVKSSCSPAPAESPSAILKKRPSRRLGERRSNSDFGHQQDKRPDQGKRSSTSATAVIFPSHQKSLDVEIKKSNNLNVPIQSSDLIVKGHPKLFPGSKNAGNNDGENLAALRKSNQIPLARSTTSPPPLSQHEESYHTSLHHRNASKKLTHSHSNHSQEDSEGEKPKNPSLAKTIEHGRSSCSTTRKDCQYSVSTDGGSEMFVTVKGNNLYSKIRSDDSVGAPQLIIGANNTSKNHLLVKNV